MSMRIISQDGCYDIPYEMAVVEWDGRYVNAHIMSKSYTMAVYFTEEKAIEAMEMCKETYEDHLEVKGKYNEVIFQYPKVFQFPKNEEVKV